MNTSPSFIGIARYAVLSLLLVSAAPALAGNATWLEEPVSGEWNNNLNWSGAYPNGFSDIATFGVSDITSIFITGSSGIDVGGIVFNADASEFTITASGNSRRLVFWAQGITNNSANTQNFVAGDDGSIEFQNSATAGSSTAFTANGRTNAFESSGVITFRDDSNAGSGSFTTHGGVGENSFGGFTAFFDNSSAADGYFVTNGGDGTDASGGELSFSHSSTAANATLIANGGTNGAYLGGGILFRHSSSGGTSHVQLNGNGFLDIHFRADDGVTIGSLEGNGDVYLGEYKLTVGSNDRTTSFSGLVQDGDPGGGGSSGGSFAKIGSGTLTLSGANTYTGGTTVDAGTLLVNNTTGSGTGSGDVVVNNAGTLLGGTGTIEGGVTVNAGATLQGGDGTTFTSLTVAGPLTLNPNAVIQLALGPNGMHSTLRQSGTSIWTFDPNQAFTFLNLGAEATTYYGIISGLADDPGSTGSWSITNVGWTGTFHYDDGDINLTVSAVPEPGTWAMGLLGLAALLCMQRRRLARLFVTK